MATSSVSFSAVVAFTIVGSILLLFAHSPLIHVSWNEDLEGRTGSACFESAPPFRAFRPTEGANDTNTFSQIPSSACFKIAATQQQKAVALGTPFSLPPKLSSSHRLPGNYSACFSLCRCWYKTCNCSTSLPHFSNLVCSCSSTGLQALSVLSDDCSFSPSTLHLIFSYFRSNHNHIQPTRTDLPSRSTSLVVVESSAATNNPAVNVLYYVAIATSTVKLRSIPTALIPTARHSTSDHQRTEVPTRTGTPQHITTVIRIPLIRFLQ